jgi:hypothetical protein
MRTKSCILMSRKSPIMTAYVRGPGWIDSPALLQLRHPALSSWLKMFYATKSMVDSDRLELWYGHEP